MMSAITPYTEYPREQSCCFVGGTPLPEGSHSEITDRLTAAVTRLVRRGVRYFYTAGAPGFDLLAARAVLMMRAIAPEIRLILVQIGDEETAPQSVRDRTQYTYIKREADDLIRVSDDDARDRFLAGHSGVCVFLSKDRPPAAAVHARECGADLIGLDEAAQI